MPLIFPKRDTHWKLNPEQYQLEAYREAMKHVTQRRVAIDCGAHVGIFTVRMEADFESVYAFEPAIDTFKCLARNTTKAKLFNCCLWHEFDLLAMRFEDHKNSGANEVIHGETGTYPAIPLDVFRIKNVDLIKMDIQGSEKQAFAGALKTLESNPVLIMEVGKDIVLEQVLTSSGYKQVSIQGKNQIWVRG